MVEPGTSDELETLLSADAEGPAARIDELAVRRLIAGALERAFEPARVAARPRRRARRAAWLCLAAIVVTGSAAAMYKVEHDRAEERRANELERGRMARAVRVQAPATRVEAPKVAAPAPAPTTALAPAAVAAAVPLANETRTGASRSAADLLERANRLRGAGDYRAAERTYVAVIAQNPAGPAAYAARVAAAELRLEQLGDAKGALRGFEQALRANSSGALAPEIYEGMAQAYRALGRARDERAALNALLAREANGPSAERARARLQVLDAAPSQGVEKYPARP